MKLRYTFPLVLLLAACSSSGPPPVGSYPSDYPREQYIEEMAEFATPGAEHKALAKAEGVWDVAVKVRETGSSEWSTGSGTAEMRMALGGRYLIEELRMTIAGRPSHAVVVHGYNRLSEHYFSIWMSENSTWPTYMDGEEDADGNVVRRGRYFDAATPGGRPFYANFKHEGDRLVTTVSDTIDGELVEVMQVYRTPRSN